MKKIVIGLTGGIASGKSTVAKMLKNMGAVIIDADEIGHSILNIGSKAYKDVVEYFGIEYLNSDGTLNRKKLGEHVFADEKELQTLNDITHKFILEKIFKDIEKSNGVVIVDCALLIETGIYRNVDEVWLVTANNNERIKRIMSRNGLSRESAIKRISAQLPDEEKAKYANAVIENNGSINELYDKLKSIIREREIEF